VMLGSTVINHQQHVGLQKLAALAGVTHSYLGPDKNLKFIQDDTSGGSALVCSCFRVLENLELTCAVGQLVYETVQAHQKVYNTGSGCLLFLAGAWSRAVLECLQRGISVSHIISAMSEGMDICLDVFRKYSISTDGLGVVQSESWTETSHGFGLQLSKKPIKAVSQAMDHLQGTGNAGHKPPNTGGQRKIKLSRHFCEAKSRNVSAASQPKPLNVAHIAEGLTHGCVSAMKLVVEINQIQSKNHRNISCSAFDIIKVVTCVLPGLPEDQSCVLPGCIVLLSAEQALVAHDLQEQHLKVALINGDLSDSFCHLGFRRPAGMQHVKSKMPLSSSKEEEWMVTVLALLLKLEVNLILISGLANQKMIQRCCRHRILVVERVKASVLKAFADDSGGVPVTYVTQLNKQCVGTQAKILIWRDLGSTGTEFSTAVNISSGANSGLATVILTSCVHGKLQALEDQFWSCAYRLHHALIDKSVLPGGGVIEMLCIHHLQKQAGQCTEGAANPYRGVVLCLMADGLIDYITTVMFNTGRLSKVKARTLVSQQLQDFNGHVGTAAKFSQLFLDSGTEDTAFISTVKPVRAPPMTIYDNVSVKQEAWRKALDLVFLVLQTDAEIITGIDQRTDGFIF
uniref:Bardet-Biedl syndrome 12 n=1 Tax=Echeneis naucrates TaxID=173247 RepID=A0A665VW10_ECHNA